MKTPRRPLRSTALPALRVTLVALTCAFILQTAMPTPARASKTAKNVQKVTELVAIKDGIMAAGCALVPEPILTKTAATVFTVKGLLFGLISFGAGLYDSVVDDRIQGNISSQIASLIETGCPFSPGISTFDEGGNPVIASFSSVAFNPASDLLDVVGGLPPSGVDPCDIIAIHGAGLSSRASEMHVLFDTTAAPVLGVMQGTPQGDAVLVAVPSLNPIPGQLEVPIYLVVNGAITTADSITVRPLSSVPFPGPMTMEYLDKAEILLTQLIEIDWALLGEIEANTDGVPLTDHDRRIVARCGNILVQRSQEGKEIIDSLRVALTPADIEILDRLLSGSPALVALDDAIDATRDSDGDGIPDDAELRATGIDHGASDAKSLIEIHATPNPADRSVHIAFALARPAGVTTRVYSVSGALVRDLVSAQMPAGTHAVFWDSLDADGKQVPMGVYFCQVTSDGQTLTQKITIVR